MWSWVGEASGLLTKTYLLPNGHRNISGRHVLCLKQWKYDILVRGKKYNISNKPYSTSFNTLWSKQHRTKTQNISITFLYIHRPRRCWYIRYIYFFYALAHSLHRIWWLLTDTKFAKTEKWNNINRFKRQWNRFIQVNQTNKC